MGGLPTMNYAFGNADLIEKVALLAPTSRSSKWTAEDAAAIEDIEILIWHGKKDVNVPYSLTGEFVRWAKGYGKEISLVTLSNDDHWSIHPEKAEDVGEFLDK